MSLPAEVIAKKDLNAFSQFVVTNSNNSKDDAVKFLTSAVAFVEGNQNNLKRTVPESDPTVELPSKLQKSDSPAPKANSSNKLQKSESAAPVQNIKVDSGNDDYLIKDEVDTSPKITLAITILSDIHLISSIIGKAGATIGLIYKASGAKVQIEKEVRHAGANATRAVFLQGNIIQIMKALQLLYKKIDEIVLSSKNLPKTSESYQMIVPNELVGFIIGKAGSVVKKIQSTTKAHIDLQTEKAMLDDTSGYYGRIVTISGSKQSRTTAIYHLLRQLATTRDLPQEWKGDMPFRIPFKNSNSSDSRGDINAMSRGPIYDLPHGMPPPPAMDYTFRRQDTSSYGGPSSQGLLPLPPPLPVPNSSMTRMMAPTPAPPTHGGGTSTTSIEVKIPNGAVSTVIGAKGSVINDIQRTSNTNIQMGKPDADGNSSERPITIKGSPFDIKSALESIDKKILEWRSRDKNQSHSAHGSQNYPSLWQRYQSLLFPQHQDPRQQQQYAPQQPTSGYASEQYHLQQQQQQPPFGYGSRDGFIPLQQQQQQPSSSTVPYAPPGHSPYQPQHQQSNMSDGQRPYSYF